MNFLIFLFQRKYYIWSGIKREWLMSNPILYLRYNDMLCVRVLILVRRWVIMYYYRFAISRLRDFCFLLTDIIIIVSINNKDNTCFNTFTLLRFLLAYRTIVMTLFVSCFFFLHLIIYMIFNYFLDCLFSFMHIRMIGVVFVCYWWKE